MREMIEHWKEGAGVLLYFGFLAFFTPKAEAMGLGYQGILFCVVIGALVVLLLYLILKVIAHYIEDHREEWTSYREYMGLGHAGSDQVSLASLGSIETEEEIDAALKSNPYVTQELLAVAASRQTRLIAAIDEEEDDEDAPVGESASRPVAAIIGENPHRRLYLAPDFQPDANQVVRAGIAVFGSKGSGKTNAGARILEQFGCRFLVPFVVFDLEGDYESLLRVLPNGYAASSQDVPTGESILRERLQVVVDLQSWKSDEERAAVICEISSGLLDYADSIPYASRVPCLVVLDEAQHWLPQTSVSYLSRAALLRLIDTFNEVGVRGRKRGLVPFLLTQRIAKINKDVISQLELKLFMKATLDNDLARYEEYIRRGVSTSEQIAAFASGQAVVCMPDGQQLVTRFYERESRHVSHTPHITTTLSPRAPGVSPSQRPAPVVAQREREREREPMITRPSYVAKPTPALPTELARALEVYRPGMSYRELGRSLNVGKDKAGSLIEQLRARRLIETAEPSSVSAAAAEESRSA